MEIILENLERLENISTLVLFLLAGVLLVAFFAFEQFNPLFKGKVESLKNELQSVKMEKIRLEEEKKSREEKIFDLKKIQEENENKEKIFKDLMKIEFENLSQKIFDQKSSQLKKDSSEQLSNILQPLKEKIKDFESKVEKHYGEEAKERFSLKDEVKRLSQINERMNEEAEQLTRALKGDVRSQGVWGEIILNRVLEASGLREGEEYIVQGQTLRLKSESNTHLKPDVIVHLPDKKRLVIDAKVSLTYYLEWTKSNQEKSLKSFIQSIRGHVDRLSSKNYAQALYSVDFVFMFFPMESAFSVALQNDPQISNDAWERSVVIVSPTTLLATLRTVNFMWQRDRENKNALEIAKKAGSMHDKFTGFLEDLKKIGDHLDKSKNSYDQAYKKLAQGKGNIISRIQDIKTLGARAKKDTSFVLDDKYEKDSKDDHLKT